MSTPRTGRPQSVMPGQRSNPTTSSRVRRPKTAQSCKDLFCNCASSRAKVHGNVIPGRVTSPGPDDKFHSTWNGRLATSREYEVLVQKWNVQGLQWIKCSCGQMSSRAVQGGHTRSGEPLYIARALTPSMDLCLGTFRQSTGRCYIQWRGREIATDEYELLCHRSRLQNRSYIYPSRPLIDSLQVMTLKSPYKVTGGSGSAGGVQMTMTSPKRASTPTDCET